MRIDHVIIGARDIAPLRELLADRCGFGVIQGSAHSDGTQGWLVPFDTPLVQYLELLTPGDESVLAGSDFGRTFLERTADGPAFLNWAALSDAIDKDAERVRERTGDDPGLLRGESVRADGRRFPWAEAAFDHSWANPSHPFFLEYGDPASRSARVPGDLAKAAHRVTPLTYDTLTVGSALTGLADWWGGGLPVTVVPADAERVRSVGIRTADGPVELTLP